MAKPGGKKRIRDYAAEYKARIARAFNMGFSRKQARGHPGKDEPGIGYIKKTLREYQKSGLRSIQENARYIVDYFKDKLGWEGRIAGWQTKVEEFAKMAIAAGYSRQEAFTLWFSP